MAEKGDIFRPKPVVVRLQTGCEDRNRAADRRDIVQEAMAEAGIASETDGSDETMETRHRKAAETSDGEERNPLAEGREKASFYRHHLVRENTQRQYDLAYCRWERFCLKSGITALPADPEHVGACLSLIMYETESLSAVEMLRAAIANKHEQARMPSPTLDPEVASLFKAYKRLHGAPREPVDPLPYDLICKMMDKLQSPEFGRDSLKAPLVLWRTVWRTVINFFTLGRFSDLEKLARADIEFRENPELHLFITYVGVKNDWYREESTKVVPSNALEPEHCPVKLTEKYFQFLGPAYRGSLQPTCLAGSRTIPAPNTYVTYSNALKELRALGAELGYPELRVGEHSAKRGGATHAAENGLNTEQLQRLGGWKSSEMPSRYVDLSISKRLKLSKTLLSKI